MRNGSNNDTKMTYFQNTDSVKIYITHFLHNKAKTNFLRYVKIVGEFDPKNIR